ncbi:MAG: hypothetical protein ACK421_07535 [Pseudanabaenaceae cyanobacterium]
MKCISCGTDNNLRDRTENQGRCKNCGTPFAFEPTAMPVNQRFTDVAFQKLLNDLSANDRVYFTKNQLFYALAKRVRKTGITTVGQFWVGYIGFLIPLTFFVILPLLSLELQTGIFIVLLVYNIIWFIYLWLRSQSLNLLRRERLVQARAIRNLGIVLMLIGLGAVWLQQAFFAILLWLTGMTAVGLGMWQARRIPNMMEASLPITPDLLDALLEKWQNAHGFPPKLLEKASFNDYFPIPGSDVTDYSFDRLVVCQSNDIAKMLIANNFHFEYNSGIVSIGGYPRTLFETVMTMAKRNPKLGVFVLHDCSPEGMLTLHRVKNDPNWFGGQDYLIVDVGISPRQILEAKRSVLVQSSEASMRASLRLEPAIRQSLAAAELQWLDVGNYVLLEFFSPPKIIQALSRSIYLGAQLSTMEDRESDLIILGDDDFYGMETFG